jgi:hypothetical protein
MKTIATNVTDPFTGSRRVRPRLPVPLVLLYGASTIGLSEGAVASSEAVEDAVRTFEQTFARKSQQQENRSPCLK